MDPTGDIRSRSADMANGVYLHLDVAELRSRGWTETLIERFLGAPDGYHPVDHWANFTGKRVFFLERVELAEASDAFASAFAASARRRKLAQATLDSFREAKRSTAGRLKLWRETRTGTDIQAEVLSGHIAETLGQAHRRGYRTPHKC